jgi:hypothetical protein
MPTTVANDLLPRIEKAAAAVRDAESALRNERELRRRLVHEAADAGVAMRAIAAALGGGTGLVSKILATPDPED